MKVASRQREDGRVSVTVIVALDFPLSGKGRKHHPYSHSFGNVVLLRVSGPILMTYSIYRFIGFLDSLKMVMERGSVYLSFLIALLTTCLMNSDIR